jgi:hypothetical protein
MRMSNKEQGMSNFEVEHTSTTGPLGHSLIDIPCLIFVFPILQCMMPNAYSLC